jgi:hypothetical protein
LAYIEGTSAVVTGSPVGLRMGGKRRRAVVKSMSRFAMEIEADGTTVELDLRPTNEATWELARRYIEERAGIEAEHAPSTEPVLR